MKLGFSGTRQGLTEEQMAMMRSLLMILDRDDTVAHGDCVGADLEFHRMAVNRGVLKIVVHPPVMSTYRAFVPPAQVHRMMEPRPYLERNKAIVDESRVLVAAPGSEVMHSRGGTWSTVRYARKIKVPTIVVPPSGKVSTTGGWFEQLR